MVALRGLGWPHLISINRSQTFQSFPSTPASPISQPSSVSDLVLQIEAAQESSHRRSMDGDRSRTPTFRSFSPHCTELHCRTPSPAQTVKEIRGRKPSHREATLLPTTIPPKLSQLEEEGILRAYSNLPSPPEGSGEDIGLEFNPHFPPSPIALAADSAADNLADLPHLPDSPRALSKFGLLSRELLDTSMRDLIQEEPDSPIGGHKAAPMKRSFNVGTLAIKDKDMSKRFLETPRIEISSPKLADCGEGSSTRPLKDRSNLSEPFHDTDVAEDQTCRPATPKSDSSIKMVTAPESPRLERHSNRSDGSNFSCDGMGLSGTNVRDFAQAPESPISPCSQLTASKISEAPIADARIPLNNFDGLITRHLQSSMPSQGLDNFLDAPTDGATLEAAPGVSTDATGQLSLPTALGVPNDAAGQLPPPETHLSKADKRHKSQAKGKKVLMKSRRIICNKAVLTVALGRQLAKPTYQALKLLSKGLPLDATEITGAAPLPAPTPV